jgi:hypothetical protein
VRLDVTLVRSSIAGVLNEQGARAHKRERIMSQYAGINLRFYERS